MVAIKETCAERASRIVKVNGMVMPGVTSAVVRFDSAFDLARVELEIVVKAGSLNISEGVLELETIAPMKGYSGKVLPAGSPVVKRPIALEVLDEQFGIGHDGGAGQAGAGEGPVRGEGQAARGEEGRAGQEDVGPRSDPGRAGGGNPQSVGTYTPSPGLGQKSGNYGIFDDEVPF